MRCLFLLVAALLATASSRAHAAGFALFEHSGRGLGSAFAGEAAIAADATTIYYNPAGLTLLSGTQFASSGFAIIPSAHFDNEGSRLGAKVGGGVLRGADGGDAGKLGLIPTFFLAHEITPRIHVGLGVSVPFGLVTEYDRGWVGRYHALTSSLETTNVNPSLAIKLADWVSIGGGADIEYAKARLTNALDFGAVCQILGPSQGLPVSLCNRLGLTPQKADGAVVISGDDWNAGYNAGVLFTPRDGTRIGLTYRSRIHHVLGGEARFALPGKASVLSAKGALVPTGGHASVDLPERVSLSGFQQIDPRWSVLADITWTRWSRFQDLVFTFDNPQQPTIVQPERWNDSFRYSLGVQYAPTAPLVFRMGTAYDESPVPNPQRRTPRIPDSDRIWLAAGVGYRVFPRVRLDLGYAHLFAVDARIDNPDPVTGARIRGTYSAHADIVGLQLTYDFGWPPLGDS